MNKNIYNSYRTIQDLINGKPMYSYQQNPEQTNQNQTNKQFIISDRFKIGRKFGNGNFGDVRLGKNMITNEYVAIKFEPDHSNSLQLENRIYEKLRFGDGIPNIFYYGHYMSHNVLVMELLGSNLEDLFNFCNRMFSLKTICMIAIQLLKRIEYVHSKNLVYRDIKPENFLVGRQSLNKHRKIYMIDFGLAKEYVKPDTGSHISYNENRPLIGTARYMSLNTHLGREQSRRDDLESIGYLLIYFLKGHLPWQGLKADNIQERYKKIGETKQAIRIEQLCSGYPKEFESLLIYARNLGFDEKPDYEKLIRSFENLILNNYWKIDWEFDWVKKITKNNLLENNQNF